VSDYLEFRGKCKELSEAAVASDPTLRLERGYYICPVWGEQSHWWTVRPDGEVFDPSVRQFPTAGAGGFYVPFDGMVPCFHCGTEMPEDKIGYIDGHHAFCNGDCYYRCVMG
jgi:hypothetical protein